MITLVAAIVAATVPNGTYLTEDGSALVRVEPCGSSICGRITDILNRDPAVPRTDTNNPEATNRHIKNSRPPGLAPSQLL